MGLARRGVVVDLDVVDLGPAHDRLLLFGRERGPAGHVVQVLLDHDVAAARELGVGIGRDQRRVGQLRSGRVGRAVDEAQQVARVEVTKAGRVVDDLRGVLDEVQQLALELEGHVLALGAQVEEQISWRRRRHVHRTPDRRERPQLHRALPGRQAIPQRRPDPDDARQPPAQVAEADVLDQVADRPEDLA